MTKPFGQQFETLVDQLREGQRERTRELAAISSSLAESRARSRAGLAAGFQELMGTLRNAHEQRRIRLSELASGLRHFLGRCEFQRRQSRQDVRQLLDSDAAKRNSSVNTIRDVTLGLRKGFAGELERARKAWDGAGAASRQGTSDRQVPPSRRRSGRSQRA